MADDGGNSTGSNVVWAFALVIIVAIIVGALYFGGVFKGKKDKTDIDVNISAPATR